MSKDHYECIGTVQGCKIVGPKESVGKKFASPGDVIEVKNLADAERLLAKGAVKKYEAPANKVEPVKKAIVPKGDESLGV